MSAAPGWQVFVESMVPVRDLAPGDRPRDWSDGSVPGADPDTDFSVPGQFDECAPTQCIVTQSAAEAAVPAAPAGSAPLTGPQRYAVQFTTTEEYVKLVERAQALLSNTLPNAALDELHLRAMQALVAELEKRKYAVTTRPRERRLHPAAPHAQNSDQARPLDLLPAAEHPQNSERAQPLDQLPATEHTQAFDQLPAAEQLPLPAQRGRHIPAATRRAVFERDRGRCSYVDAFGRACRETHCLELHHLRAFARGGGHTLSNLTLRCRSHNTLAAEEEFGRDLIERRRGSPQHEASAVRER